MKTFGDTLKEVLSERGMKAVELSALCGLNEPYLSRLMNGKQRDPTFAKGLLIVEALGMTATEFAERQKADG